MRTIIAGLGNPMLGDDGIGLHVARALHSKLDQADTTVVETSTDGLDFLELLAGYDRAIIIDAIQTSQGEAGQIYRLEPETLQSREGANTSHSLGFLTAIELGRKLALNLPRQIVIFAVEVKDVDSYCEECCPEVRAAIPECIKMLFQELKTNPCT